MTKESSARRTSSCVDRVKPKERDLRLTPDQLDGLRQAMLAVVNSGTATAGLASEVGLKQYGIAGKTGSGQVTGAEARSDGSSRSLA